ncbi:TPA: hypothetical protein I8Y95_003095 [Legionella pneumophila]|nr:hypothetical protein [Legionella pneumophila]
MAPAFNVPVQVLLVIEVPAGNPDVLTCTLFAGIEPVFSMRMMRGLPTSAGSESGKELAIDRARFCVRGDSVV